MRNPEHPRPSEPTSVPERDEAPKKREHAVDPKVVRQRVEMSYDLFEEGADRLAGLKKEMVDRLARTVPDRAEDLKEHFGSIETTKADGSAMTKEEIIDAVSTSLSEFFDANFTAEDLEQVSRKAFVRESGFTELSKLLSFNTRGKEAYIHLAPGRTMRPKQLINDVRAGLQELAKRVETDESLKDVDSVHATSWIVARHPKLMERLGFTVTGAIEEELRRKRFADDTRDIWHGEISKEDLLRLYGRNDGDDHE